MGLFSSHNTYINSEGVEVPSVTTVIGVIDKPYLKKWANAMGFKRINTDSVLKKSATIGTAVHYCIECLLGHSEFEMKDEFKEFTQTIAARVKGFKEFLEGVELEPIELETSFASDKFGGTIDYYGKLDDKTVLLDWKTSNKMSSTMFLQLGGYLWHSENIGRKIDGCGIVHVTEKGSVLHYKTREEMQQYIDTFLLVLDFFHAWYKLNEEEGWGSIL